MFIRNGKRFNIYAGQTITVQVRDPESGETTDQVFNLPAGFFTDPDNRARYNVEEIPDPFRESEVTHYVQEIDSFPYVINTPKPAEILADQQAKAARVAQDETDRLTAAEDAVIKYLVNHTPTECYQYVMTNVTTLAQAKDVLGKMAGALSVLARSQLR